MKTLQSNTHCITCDISYNSTESPVDFKILLDEEVVFNEHTNMSKYSVSHEFNACDSTAHSLKFVLSNKTNAHTVIDSDGRIVKSAHIELNNIAINGIDITKVLLSNDCISAYTHNNNNNDIPETINYGFDNLMGFNGELNIQFDVPIDKWIRSKNK